MLEIGRERKYELYDMFIQMPKPLVAAALAARGDGAIGARTASVEIPLDLDAALREVEALVAQGVESLAVVFLHAYANPAHERARRRRPWRAASRGCRCRSPRTSRRRSANTRAPAPPPPTPMCGRWRKPTWRGWRRSCARAGIPGGLFLMLSNGGLTHVAEAKRAPVQLLESGPAAGALAGAWFGRNAGLDRVLAFDMGGTTAKLALVDGGEPLVAWGFEAARERRFLRGSGLPIQIATVELIEIGAGGGSIARRSGLGTLQVGPESSGAQPGPACYGRGGTEPTVTDADLALGYLDAAFFLGGAMRIDAEAAEAALGRLAAALAVGAGARGLRRA